MNRTQKIFPYLMLLFLGACSSQKHVLDHSINFLDKWGLVTGYEIQYITKATSPLNDVQKENLFYETRKIISAYGREIELKEFYYKRDSIEEKFIHDLKSHAKIKGMKIKDIKINNLLVPEQILKAIILKSEVLNEPQPTRIKSF